MSHSFSGTSSNVPSLTTHNSVPLGTTATISTIPFTTSIRTATSLGGSPGVFPPGVSSTTTAIYSTSALPPLQSLIPPSGWNSTMPPPFCTGTVATSGCIEEGRMTTKVISYGSERFIFVFPTPDVTTTQSFWTGTYPTIIRSEPSATTTRITRLSAISGLPSFRIITPRLDSPSTFITTIVSHSVTQTKSEIVPAAEPSICGESGNFTLTFDDTTVASGTLVQGMNNPYHHLFYANGFTYVPDKWEPFPAISQPNVAMFLPLTGKLLPNNAFAGSLLPGELGAGPRASVDAYWFRAYGGWFGCALNGITACTLQITGYRYDDRVQQEVVVAEQEVVIPACWGYIGCRLTEVVLGEQFYMAPLSGIQFGAFTKMLGIRQVFVMDDLKMEWWNGSCAAGILRMGHR